MKHILKYAHCIKFTTGQLDRYPYSEYENRAVEVSVEQINYGSSDEFLVIKDKTLIGEGDTLKDALNHASYTLMDRTRVGFRF